MQIKRTKGDSSAIKRAKINIKLLTLDVAKDGARQALQHYKCCHGEHFGNLPYKYSFLLFVQVIPLQRIYFRKFSELQTSLCRKCYLQLLKINK